MLQCDCAGEPQQPARDITRAQNWSDRLPEGDPLPLLQGCYAEEIKNVSLCLWYDFIFKPVFLLSIARALSWFHNDRQHQ